MFMAGVSQAQNRVAISAAHFDRMACLQRPDMKKATRLLFVAIALLSLFAGLVVAARYVVRELSIDRCLDSGGRWADEDDICH